MTKINIDTIVRCINDEFKDSKNNRFKKNDLTLPRYGFSYTVREIFTNKDGTGIRLKEIINKKYFYGANKGFLEPLFGIYRFIPVKK